MKQLKLYMTLVFAVFLTAGCGGGGDSSAPHVTTYTGSTTAASLDASKAETYIKATSDTALNEGIVPLFLFDIPILKSTSDKVMAAHKQALNMLMQETVPDFCDTGSVDATDSDTNTTIRFANCSYNGITFNGTVTYTYNGFYNFTFTNFDLILSDSLTIFLENMTLACFSPEECTISSDFTGSDGRIYRIENSSMNLLSYPYEFYGRLYHPDHGYVDLSGNIYINSCETVSRPTSGTLSITGTNGVANVTFIDCDSFSIDFDSAVTTGNW